MKNLDKENIVIVDDKSDFIITIKKGSGWLFETGTNKITFYGCEMKKNEKPEMKGVFSLLEE